MLTKIINIVTNRGSISICLFRVVEWLNFALLSGNGLLTNTWPQTVVTDTVDHFTIELYNTACIFYGWIC